MHEWRRVQHAQLVELPVVHAVGEEHADVLEVRPPGGESVFDHPLAEGLGDDGQPSSIPTSSRSQARSVVGRSAA